MHNRFFPRHCSDEQLLAHLDGELPAFARLRTKRHLERCWHCRGRMDELEKQAHAVSKAFLDADFPWPQRIGEAKTRFQLQRRPPARGAQSRSLLAGVPRPAWWIGVVTAGLLAAIGTLLLRHGHRAESIGKIVADSRLAESAIRGQAVHQVFQLEIAEQQPGRFRKGGTLEVWYDGATSQFASAWKDPRGNLRHALWRPNVAEEYILDAATSLRPARRPKPGTSVGIIHSQITPSQLIQPEHLETAFLRWLESRAWTPIGVESGLLVLVSQEGVRMAAEPAIVNGSRVYRLRATRTRNGLTAEVTVEVDAATYRPRVQSLRLDDGTRSVELRLVTERFDTQKARTLPASLFQPAFPDTRPVNTAPLHVEAVPAVAEAPDPAWLDAREVEVYYALHQAKACLGEPVEVVRRDGAITVSGLVETAERRTQLTAMLAPLCGKPWLNLDLKIPGEVSRSLHKTAASTPPLDSNGADTKDPPAWPTLAKHFQDVPDARQQIAHFATQAISLSDAASREAWALRRLAERFGPARELSPRSRWLLQRMLHDHAAGARQEIAALRNLLTTVWTAIPHSSEASADSGLPWPQNVLALFDRIERVHSVVYGQFTGADLGAGAGSELASCFLSIEPDLDTFEAAGSRQSPR